MSAGRQSAGLVRPDGRAKRTGATRYSADGSTPGLVHAALVTATVPRGLRRCGSTSTVPSSAADSGARTSCTRISC